MINDMYISSEWLYYKRAHNMLFVYIFPFNFCRTFWKQDEQKAHIKLNKETLLTSSLGKLIIMLMTLRKITFIQVYFFSDPS